MALEGIRPGSRGQGLPGSEQYPVWPGVGAGGLAPCFRGKRSLPEGVQDQTCLCDPASALLTATCQARSLAPPSPSRLRKYPQWRHGSRRASPRRLAREHPFPASMRLEGGPSPTPTTQ